MISRRAALNRRTRALIAVVTASAVTLGASGIALSLAGWTSTEYDNGTVSSLNCATGSPFTTTAWSQELAGNVAGTPLSASNLAGVTGFSVASGTPNSTVVAGTGATGLSYLGSDAWSSNLGVGALNSISIGAGVSLPIGANTGTETQYARATATGTATGASGAITTAAGGLVSLQNPTSTTPGVGSISLATALSGTINHDLATDITQLANASITVGALGSTTTIDSCNALWDGASAASAVVRSYVLAKLGLAFTSSLIGTATSTATGSVNTLTKASETTLTTTLNALQPLGNLTGSSLTAVTSALRSALPATAGGQAVSLGSPTTVQVGVTFDPSPALAVLNSTITAGPVSINLATGEIDGDIAGLGALNLNSLPANSSLLSTAVLSALKTDIGTAINTWVTSTLQPALTATLNSASVVVQISSFVALTLPALGTVNVATLSIGITGTLGNFISPGGSTGTPVVTVTLTSIATTAISNALALLGLNLTTLLAGITSTLNTTVPALVVPAIATSVLSPLLTIATTDVGSAVTSLTASLSPVITSLGTVVGVIGNAVQLTVNDQPDQPNPVGYPDSPAAGRFFESALKVGVINTTNGSSTLALYLGSSSVGPNTEN